MSQVKSQIESESFSFRQAYSTYNRNHCRPYQAGWPPKDSFYVLRLNVLLTALRYFYFYLFFVIFTVMVTFILNKEKIMYVCNKTT